MRPHLWLIALLGVIVPRTFRADWQREWESELRFREQQLAQWDRLDGRARLDLLKRSACAFWDALWLQRRRFESEVFQDVRYGVRLLIANRWFSIVAILTLALGIGANTAMFTLLDKVLIRSLPVDRPGELVTFAADASGKPESFSYPVYLRLRHHQALAGLAAYSQRPFSIAVDGGESARVVGQVVSGNYFDVLGVRPAVGRFFLPEEDVTPGKHPVVVISHGLWRRYFAADPKAIGKTMTLNGSRYDVIGVTPAEFAGTTRGVVCDAYVPTMMQARVMDPQRPRSMLDNPNASWLRLVARLEPGVTREQAQAGLGTAMSEASATGTRPPGQFTSTMLLMDGRGGDADRIRDLSLALKLMMAVVALVLLAACANIANLLLARASTRQKEIAVRLAVGANRWRIIRQLLTESAILTVLGGLAGLVVASWSTRLLLGFDQPTTYVPRSFDVSIDTRVLAFTAGLSMLTALIFSLAPSVTATSPSFGTALKGDSPGSSGSRHGKRFVQNGLVVLQVSLSLVVLIAAGLSVRSLQALDAIDPGFEPAKVVTGSFDLSAAGYSEARGRQFVADLSDRAAALPGVEAVAFAHVVAFSDAFWISGATPEGFQPAPGEMLSFDFNVVTPDFFRTLGAPIVSGRAFSELDRADAPRVAMINEATARKYWPGQDAVGKRLQRGPQSLEIVGVVRDGKDKGLTRDTRPAIFLPFAQTYMAEQTLHVRSAMNPHQLLEAVRRAAQSLDPALPIYNLRTLAEQRDGSLYANRAVAAVLTLFAGLALVVCGIGLYGILSYAVTERRREMGIRLAHGAQPKDLLRLIVGHGMTLTAIGLAAGLAAAFAVTRLTRGLLFGVSPTDPLIFATIPIVLLAVAVLASAIPAWQATRVDPVASLRSE